MGTDAVAVIGFLALFALMLLRVPVGMAMGLVGVSGFAYLVGGGPARQHPVAADAEAIHPPVGMNVFVIKSVVKDVKFSTIFVGVLPFIVTDLIRLVILIAFPIIALYLPTRM